ncbi:MAG: D-aminoacyl-tRNA deacylase, partial [Muribaculaceae bacterium]|nr:D-aminoacyl-tRNA deacylase [Muribaculaceae bacterium]
MRLVIQRVARADVRVGGELISECGRGLLILV